MRKLNNHVSILGCGNGGMALAAYLKLKGANVALWSDPNHDSKFRIVKERDNNCITLIDNNIYQTAKIDLLSYNIDEVVEFSDIIYNCTPMIAHNNLFNKLSTYINHTKKTKFLINLSGVFSCVDQLIKHSNSSIYNHLVTYDTATFPFACRVDESNHVYIFGKKSELAIAPLFPTDAAYLDLLPETIKPCKLNIIENSIKLGLMGTNAVFHPATVLFNARLIDCGASFLFYKDGISKRTSLLHEALDQERLMLARVMGYELAPCVVDDNKLYGTNFQNSYDFSVNSSVHKKIEAPSSLNHRFITEDIAYGLVPLTGLSKLYNVSLPNIESIISIFSTIMNIDFYKNGRNLFFLTKELIESITEDISLMSRESA